MPGWVVTGGSGFLGRHILGALGGRVDVRVLGRTCPLKWPLDQFIEVNLEEPESLARAIGVTKPDVVIHAAGRTPPADPGVLYRGNTLATVHLLDALRADGRVVRVVIAGSAAEVGPVEVENLPVDEDHPCRPIEPYGLSKWLATCAGLAARPPLEVVVARVFNPIGPGQPLNQALGRFAARLAENEEGPLIVGDLNGRRDFIDVRDVARALIALADRGESGRVYNVGTGHSRRVGDGLDHLIRLSGRAIEVQVNPDRHGSPGPSDSRAKIDRIVTATAWRPEIAWETSLEDLWIEASNRARFLRNVS